MNKTQSYTLFHILVTGILTLFLAVLGQAQNKLDDLPSATTWRSFQLNAALPAEIIKALGKPKKDKTEISKQALANGWTEVDDGNRVRRIAYKKIGLFDSVEFTFIENRLVEMNFLFKQNKRQGIAKSESNFLPAVKIPEIFQTDFLLF